ncbi:MAG: VCBS repeat-containing protein [Acidobacteriaceae bacterium]
MKYPCSRLVAALCAGLVSLGSFGQNAPTFTSVVSPNGPTPNHVYGIDVNNDGLTDIVQSGIVPNATTAFFTVSINNGDGTFKPPVSYTVNAGTWPALAWGDFNKDGKVDIAFALPGTNQVAVYLGNGDGTFQSPVTMTMDLPSGYTFATSSVVAADFNHDGNIDLVASGYQGDNSYAGPWAVFLLYGDGEGHFNNPSIIYQPTSGWLVDTIVTGDFDSDDNADVSIMEYLPCAGIATTCIGNTYESNVLTLFGDGTGSFDPIDVTTIHGAMSLGAQDLNNDGATDLYGMEYLTDPSSTELAVFLGHYGRQFGYRFTPVPASLSSDIGAPMVAADFNGTTAWDLAALSTTYSGSSPSTQMVYFLDPGNDSTATIVTGPSPAGTSGYQSGLVVGHFEGDARPDIAVNESAAGNSPTTITAAGLNTTQGYYGACNYPSAGQGIFACIPPATNPAGALRFGASANSYGQLRKMELWVDGAKLAEQHWDWGPSSYFDWTWSNPSPGTHAGTIYAADIDNTLQRYDFTFTVNP